MPRGLLIDTDTASDDAVALIMALRSPDTSVLAITTVAGNVGVEQASRNALYVAELCGSAVPVYQGSAAPLGQMNFVVKGVMIGGFALVAAPAEYSVTGVKTFIVSHDGVVYEKDLGTKTLDEFKTMELFNPDKSWAPVPEQG